MIMTRRCWLALPAVAILTWAAGASPSAAQGRDVLVFAAASLKNALDEVAAQWQRETGKKASISYAASNTLTSQSAVAAPSALLTPPALDRSESTQQTLPIKPCPRSCRPRT